MRTSEERASEYASSHKLPPQNLEAEQSVIGSMLIDNQKIPEIRRILYCDDFYREAHVRIFNAITDLVDKGIQPDLVTLVNELKARNELDAVGGTSYIASLIDATPTAENFWHYAEIVQQKSLRRMAIQFSTDLITKAYEDGADLDVVAFNREATIELMKMAARAEKDVQKRLTPEHIFKHFADYRETSFKSLDSAIGAFFAGELIVVGGRTGMGKTALMLEFIKKTAIEENRLCAFFHAQMDEVTLRTRLLSSVSGVPYNDLRKGKIERGKQSRQVLRAQEQIDDAPISWFVTRGQLEANWIMAKTRGLLDKKGDLGLVIIENLQQIFWEKIDKFKNERKREADMIVNAFRAAGIETKVPHLISSQLTKDSEKENRRPQIGDLKETGRTGELADKVLMPYRPNYESKTCKLGEPEQAELIVCKGGQPVILEMEFIGSILTWREKT